MNITFTVEVFSCNEMIIVMLHEPTNLKGEIRFCFQQ